MAREIVIVAGHVQPDRIGSLIVAFGDFAVPLVAADRFVGKADNDVAKHPTSVGEILIGLRVDAVLRSPFLR